MKSFSINNSLFLLIGVTILFYACNESKPSSLFILQEETGIDFSNDISDSKDFNILTYRNFYNGGGVATGDINNDGLPDIFFTSNMGDNKLYLNKGDFNFEDISKKAGLLNKGKWGTGVVMADINHDGWLDIYVCNAGYQKGIEQQNELYINNHDLTFTEAGKHYGLDDSGYTTHAAFFDYDLDGDLDCYLLNNSFIPVNTLNYANKRKLRAKDWPVADFLKGGGDKLLRNDSGKFVDVSDEVGIFGSLIGFGLGVTVGDVNGDNYPDIYISNDFFERDYLYINEKNGTFKEDLENWVEHTSLASMGADIGDINNDGYPDIFTTDMLPGDDYRLKTTSSFDNYDVYQLKVKQGFYHQYMQNTLQLNNRNGKFLDIANYSGVQSTDWSWGGVMFDADNDGFNDLFVCNGINRDVTNQDFIDFFANDVIQKMVLTGQKEDVDNIFNKMPSKPIPNKAFKNMGNNSFTDVSKTWGLTQPSFSNGATYADLDNDGDLDLVVNNVNQKAFVYKNNSRESNKNNYLAISLTGKGDNTFAVGSTVKVHQGDQVLTREIMPSRGFQSSVDYKVIIGLGTKQIDSLVIIWPDRSYTSLQTPKINTVLKIKQPETGPVFAYPTLSDNGIVKESRQKFEKHSEDDYVDFYYERNIPMMISREGPKAAIGDVDGDGLADIYIGGGAGQKGQLYVQTSSGYKKKDQVVFTQFASYEDVTALFFDCDNDGDLDLFVGSGGNNHPAGSIEYQNRLFENDGKGNFNVGNSLPFSGMNTSVAVANDFDKDGDLDLFIGSRSVPYNYGLSPTSYILVNDGTGKFTNYSNRTDTSIFNIGMVTSAKWVNIIGDSAKELVVVGEYMAPKIFSYAHNSFSEVATNLSELVGCWQEVEPADVDGDGDEDLILGNIGENFYLRPTKERPVKMWINDFDNNGSTEKIITRTVNGKDVPVFLKKELTDQLVSIKKQNLHYEDFARKSIEELLPSNVLQTSGVKTFNYPASCIAINHGNGKFTIKKLPAITQLSSINSVLCIDLNEDKKIDLVVGGNNYGIQPQFGRLDASFGNILLNNGNGDFKPVEAALSGLQIKGEIRDIREINGKKSNNLLFLRNNDYPVLYNIQKSLR